MFLLMFYKTLLDGNIFKFSKHVHVHLIDFGSYQLLNYQCCAVYLPFDHNHLVDILFCF